MNIEKINGGVVAAYPIGSLQSRCAARLLAREKAVWATRHSFYK